MAEEIAIEPTGRNLREVLRYVIGVAIGLLVLVLLFGKRAELQAAAHQLGHADPVWIAAAVASESVSLLAFALLQRRALRLSGARLGLGGLYAVTLANDAIANTVPGEPAVSSAYRYRYYRRHGAAAPSAGWTIFTVIVAQAVGMSVVLLLGVLVALAASAAGGGGRHTGVAVAGLVIVLASGAVLVRRDLVLRLAAAAARGLRRITGGRSDGVIARIEATLHRMREIPLSARSTAGVVLLATAVWGANFGTLLCAFRAVHGSVPWSGVLLAYGVAEVAGNLPIVPGGIGIIEGSLAVVLVAYGARHSDALAATLAFRIVSFWLAIAIGWLTVALLARHSRRSRALPPCPPGGSRPR
ncbi:MAG TPA: YbhN family protein [Streptosporangiaceae bacterium]